MTARRGGPECGRTVRRRNNVAVRRGQSGGLGGVLSQFAGRDAGSFLGSGLNDLVERFTQAGHGEAAQSG